MTRLLSDTEKTHFVGPSWAGNALARLALNSPIGRKTGGGGLASDVIPRGCLMPVL